MTSTQHQIELSENLDIHEQMWSIDHSVDSDELVVSWLFFNANSRSLNQLSEVVIPIRSNQEITSIQPISLKRREQFIQYLRNRTMANSSLKEFENTNGQIPKHTCNHQFTEEFSSCDPGTIKIGRNDVLDQDNCVQLGINFNAGYGWNGLSWNIKLDDKLDNTDTIVHVMNPKKESITWILNTVQGLNQYYSDTIEYIESKFEVSNRHIDMNSFNSAGTRPFICSLYFDNNPNPVQDPDETDDEHLSQYTTVKTSILDKTSYHMDNENAHRIILTQKISADEKKIFTTHMFEGVFNNVIHIVF